MRENASRTLMLHQAVADRFGLGSTDMKAMDLARGESGLTAGRLAELTGLSGPAVTALLDRLERRGLIERQRDPHDRRKVLVIATDAHVPTAGPIFAGISDRVRALLDEYDDDALATFLEITRRLNEMARDYTRELTEGDVRRHHE